MSTLNFIPPLKTKTSIFLLPHQDDEFGVFHSISREILKKKDVWCIFFTHGSDIDDLRNQESLKVLCQMGVEPEKILFQGLKLNIKDGTIVNNLKAASDWLLSFLQSLNNIDYIFTPAWEGGHPDHDALHAVTIFVTLKLNILDHVRQFPLYNAFNCRPPFFRVISPLKENGDIERESISKIKAFKFIKLCFGYRSQIKTWIGLLPFVVFSYIFIGKQHLQKVSIKRLSERPHKGKLYYENRKFDTWENMQILINKYLISNK